MQLRSTARWALTHGLFRVSTARAGKAGNPDALIILDPQYLEDHDDQIAALRAGRPFGEGAFGPMSVHHDVCKAILRSDDFRTFRIGEVLPGPIRRALALLGENPHPGPVDPPSMLVVDGPTHARYRRLVSRAFTARAVAGLRERTEAAAAELLDELAAADDREVDLVSRYAKPLPVRVICEMLGIGREHHDQLLRWGDGAALSLEAGLTHADATRAAADLADFHDWIGEHLRRLRANPGPDLFSTMVTVTDDDGSRLSDQELATTAMLLLAAGFETTVNLIGSGAGLLADHADQRALLAERPELWPNAVEEMLRMEPPVQRLSRRALRDTAVAGHRLTEGTIAFMLIREANRDPEVFADPLRFDVTRANARDHLSFSAGPHFCLGSALARMEGEVGLRALFARFPDLRSAGPRERKTTVILHGVERFPARLVPARPPATVD